MKPSRDIPQRELRNNIGAVLREVEAGSTMRVTVRGRAVAELRPLSERKASLSPADVALILRDAPLDTAFTADVAAIAGTTIDEL